MEPTPIVEIDTVAYWKKIKTAEIEEIFLPGEFWNGWIKAQKNGKDWNASTGVLLWDLDHFYITATTFSQEAYIREDFFFAKVPKKIGLYRFNKNLNDLDGFVTPSYARRGSDGDVTLVLLFHNTDYVETDFLELTKLDTVNRIITGRFDVHLTDSLIFPFPVYLHLANGTFETKY